MYIDSAAGTARRARLEYIYSSTGIRNEARHGHGPPKIFGARRYSLPRVYEPESALRRFLQQEPHPPSPPLLRYGLRRYDEAFYASLYASRKDTVFFGIAMGLLISAISTPSCARGAWSAWTALRLGASSTPWTLNEDTQRCVTARAILWISELNRLDLYPLYVVHHAGALLSLLSFLHLRWPVLPIISIFATLVSEIPGDMLWMLSAFIDSLPTPSAEGVTVFSRKADALQKFKQRLIHFNVVQYTVLRGAGILFVVWLLAFNPFPDAALWTRSIPAQMHAYVLLGLYAAFCALYVVRQWRSLRVYRWERAEARESGVSGERHLAREK
uniref:TLC domain-containing protein n=1 Tax=Mycena chlorophos TaxID=658473 RepID=A0ABQ0LBH2_MYCCL|nr:predicted protein [Mycena chlorophos]